MAKTKTDQQQDIMLAEINTQLSQILAEVKKTNGRVTVIETWKSKIQGAYSAIVVICSIGAFVIGILASTLWR